MKVLIVGNGIAGITAARFLRKESDYEIVMISDETDYFFSRTALMYIYMGDETFEQTKPYEDWFWEKNRIQLVRDRVDHVDPHSKKVHLQNGNRELSYDKLLLATGSKSNFFGWPGQDLEGVQGLYSYQDLENMEHYTQGIDRAIVVGGGLIGVELAEMLDSREIPATYLVRETGFAEHLVPQPESTLISDHTLEHGIDLRLETEITEILGDDNGRVRAVVTNHGEEIPCQFVAIAAGVHPNLTLASEIGLETQKGILVDDYLETSISDIFAAGDCVQMRQPRPDRRAIEPVWYTGRLQGKYAAYNMLGAQVPYDPGVWFNSAKFFDIEYQVYGQVHNPLADNEEAVQWHSQDGRKSIRVQYRTDGERGKMPVTAFLLLGVRYRHKVCEEWIANSHDVRDVLAQLEQANFDPEFTPHNEKYVREKFRVKHPELTLEEPQNLLKRLFKVGN